MEKKILLAVQMTSYRPRADRSMSLTFTTAMEVEPQKVMEIAQLHNSIGVLLFSNKETLDQHEQEMIDNIDSNVERKSYAQRLRAVLYLYHKQMGGDEAEFHDFYARTMEGVISKYKDRLE